VPALAYTLVLSLLLLQGCSRNTIRPDVYTAPETRPPGTLRVEGHVEVEGRDLGGRAVIVVKAPEYARIDLLGPLRRVAAVIVTGPDGLSFYSNGDTVHYSWDDPLLPYSLRPGELVSILTGTAEAGDYQGSGTDAEGNVTVLTRPVRGPSVLKVLFDDWRVVDGVALPFSIDIDDGRERLRIGYSSVDMDPVVDIGLFTLPVRGRSPVRGRLPAGGLKK
jgi:hypothetical protein